MKQLIVTAVALMFVALAGCANMPGGVMGTSATDAFAHELHPAGPWPQQRYTYD